MTVEVPRDVVAAADPGERFTLRTRVRNLVAREAERAYLLGYGDGCADTADEARLVKTEDGLTPEVPGYVWRLMDAWERGEPLDLEGQAVPDAVRTRLEALAARPVVGIRETPSEEEVEALAQRFAEQQPGPVTVLPDAHRPLLAAADGIVAAVKNPGRNPGHHDKVTAKHREEWPVLWDAIDRLIAARSRRA